MEGAGIALASIGLFLQIWDTCDRLYRGYKITAAFGPDFICVVAELEMQWARYTILVKGKKIAPGQIDTMNLDTGHGATVQRYLKAMLKYFRDAEKINQHYYAHQSEAPTEPASAAPQPQGSDAATPATGSSTGTLVSSKNQRRSQTAERGWPRLKNNLKFWKNKDDQLMVDTLPQSPGHEPVNGPSSVVSDDDDEKDLNDDQPPVFHDQNLHGFGQRKRIKWARRDREEFWNLIGKLKAGNDNLESFLNQFVPASGALVLARYERAHLLWPLIDLVRKLLSNLHEDLMEINSPLDLPKDSSCGAVHDLSIQLVEDHSRAKERLANRPGLRALLRDDSLVFTFQSHCGANPESEPQLLLFESRLGPATGTPAGSSLGSNYMSGLHQPPADTIQSFKDKYIERWGRISSDVEGQDDHIVYHSKQLRWSRVATLRDLILSPEYRQRLRPQQVVQLARLVLSSHLCLDQIHQVWPIQRPENYMFYLPVNDSELWSSKDPVVLSPWLGFGFGTRPEAEPFGLGSGVEGGRKEVMNELALMLIQIGCGEILEYGAGSQGFSAAKKKALQLLPTLDRRVSSGYTQVVHGLLDFEPVPIHLRSEEDDKNEDTYVKSAISALHKLDNELEGTEAAPLLLLNAAGTGGDRPEKTSATRVDSKASGERSNTSRQLATPKASVDYDLDRAQDAAEVDQSKSLEGQHQETDASEAVAGAENATGASQPHPASTATGV